MIKADRKETFILYAHNFEYAKNDLIKFIKPSLKKAINELTEEEFLLDPKYENGKWSMGEFFGFSESEKRNKEILKITNEIRDEIIDKKLFDIFKTKGHNVKTIFTFDGEDMPNQLTIIPATVGNSEGITFDSSVNHEEYKYCFYHHPGDENAFLYIIEDYIKFLPRYIHINGFYAGWDRPEKFPAHLLIKHIGWTMENIYSVFGYTDKIVLGSDVYYFKRR
jgi:hypothetical protein